MIRPFKAIDNKLIIKWDKVTGYMYGTIEEKEMILHTDPTILKKNPNEMMPTGRTLHYTIVKVLTDYGALELNKEISEEFIEYLKKEVEIKCWTASKQGKGIVVTATHT